MAPLKPQDRLLYAALIAVPVAIAIGSRVAAGGTNTNGKPEGPTPETGAGPGKPALAGGEIVARGFASNPFGVKVVFQIEALPSAAGNGAAKDYFGVIFEPWNDNNPVVVTQKATREEARDATLSYIGADAHGSPG